MLSLETNVIAVLVCITSTEDIKVESFSKTVRISFELLGRRTLDVVENITFGNTDLLPKHCAFNYNGETKNAQYVGKLWGFGK